jgi:hypothetical protein
MPFFAAFLVTNSGFYRRKNSLFTSGSAEADFCSPQNCIPASGRIGWRNACSAAARETRRLMREQLPQPRPGFPVILIRNKVLVSFVTLLSINTSIEAYNER